MSSIRCVPTSELVDLKTTLNTCKSSSPAYIRIVDLKEDFLYPITHFERVSSPFGPAIVAILEGQILDGQNGEDFFLKAYLPKRFSDVITNFDIERYNMGMGERLSLVKRPAQPGTTVSPLEFV